MLTEYTYDMTVYLEYAIIDNLVINCLLLWFMFRTVKNKSKQWWKIALCVFVGLVFAIAVPLLSAGLLLFFQPQNFGIAVSVLMVVKVLVTVMFVFVMSKLIKYLTVREKVTNFLRDVVITYRDKEYKIKGYLDTGNRLVDPEGNVPIVVISHDLYMKMFPVVKGHYVQFNTVGKAGKMFVFEPKGFMVGDSNFNVRLGVSMKKFRDAAKYDALLNASLA